MKKLLIVVLAVLLIFGGYLGYRSMKDKAAQPQTPSETASAGDAAEESAEGYGITYYSLDLEAIYALHDPDEIVGTADGRDVTWGEYFYWLAGGAVSVENYMLQMAFYGGEINWEDAWGEDPDEDFFDYVFYSAEENVKPFAVVENIAEEYNVELDETSAAELAEKLREYRIESVGEDATDEEYVEYLSSVEYLDLPTLEKLMRDSALYQVCFTAIYGDNGALISEEDAMAYLAENGYVKANHILRVTKDMGTGEELGEDEAAQKEAEAAAIAAQLQAIEEPEELLARLAELKEIWDEDSGKTEYPDGYVFSDGEMVEEFYNTALSLGNYNVSDPVLSPYGYHVIVRLPLDPDTVLGYSSEGTPITARAALANERFSALLDERLQQAEFIYAPGFEKPDLSARLVEQSF